MTAMHSNGPARSPTTPKARILVLDDDRLVLATVVHGLVQAGYDVIDADNGDDAILLAREHRPELALLDIRMEGKTGFDVAEYLRDVCRIPFMFLSAFSDEATAAKVQALGAVAYLVKPLDVGKIVPTVDAALQRLRSGQAAGAEPAAAAAAVGAPAAALALDPVALAVGIVMHRYSLSREGAWQRVQRLAHEQGINALQQAERLVQAVEELARGSDPGVR